MRYGDSGEFVLEGRRLEVPVTFTFIANRADSSLQQPVRFSYLYT